MTKDVTYSYYRSKYERRRGKGDGGGCPSTQFDHSSNPTKYWKGCPTLAVMKSWEEILAEGASTFDAPEQKVEYPEITEDNNVCPVAQWKSATNKCWDYGVWLCGRQWDKCSPSGRYYCKLEKYWNKIGKKMQEVLPGNASLLGQRYISFSSQLHGRTGQIKKPPATNS